MNESNLEAGDEIASYDGNQCVGAIKLSETNIKKNIVSIQASVSDLDIINGFTEGNPVKLRAWQINPELEFQPQPEVIKGNNLYQKHGSVFYQLPEKQRNETSGDSLMRECLSQSCTG